MDRMPALPVQTRTEDGEPPNGSSPPRAAILLLVTTVYPAEAISSESRTDAREGLKLRTDPDDDPLHIAG